MNQNFNFSYGFPVLYSVYCLLIFSLVKAAKRPQMYLGNVTRALSDQINILGVLGAP